MPQEPKRRHSRGRKGKRRASIKLKLSGFGVCPNCKSLISPHTVCKKCGYYDGQKIMTLKKEKATSVPAETTNEKKNNA